MDDGPEELRQLVLIRVPGSEVVNVKILGEDDEPRQLENWGQNVEEILID